MKKTFYHCLLAAASVHGAVQAETPSVSSEALGYTTTPLHGGYGGSARKNNIVSPNLVNPVSWQGTVAAINGDQVTLTGAPMAADVFRATSLSPKRFAYYLNTTDGYWAHIVGNDANSVTLQAGFAADLTVGEAVIIRRHLTISDYFGNNEIGLKSSPSGNLDEADKITLIDQENNGNITIFPSNAMGGIWMTPAFEDAAAYPIYPDQGLQISRLGTDDLVLESTGEVDTKGRQIRVTAGTNVRPITLPTSVTLGGLSLYTGDPATGLVGSDSGDLGTADSVRVTFNGVTSSYFYSTIDLGAGPGWYDSAFQFASDRVLPAGAALVIKRSNPVNSAPFIWKSPAPAIQ